MAAVDGGLPFTLFVAVTLKPFETRAVTTLTSTYSYQYLHGRYQVEFGLRCTRMLNAEIAKLVRGGGGSQA